MAVQIPVVLAATSTVSVLVDYAISGGTATGGGIDYSLNPGTLTFSAGESTQFVNIAVVNDRFEEEDETIEITLSAPTNAVLGTPIEFTYTILANDKIEYIYSTYVGGSGFDAAYDITKSTSGYFVVGALTSTNFPLAMNIQPQNAGGYDVLLAKLSGNMTPQFSSYLGGSSNDHGLAIAVDSSDAVYITGNTSSTNFPTVSPLIGTLGGPVDAFITKIYADGTGLVYSTYGGGSSNDFGTGIAVDTSGSAVVVGYSDSPDFPTATPIQGTNGGQFDVTITKLTPDGSGLDYSTYLGGTSNDQAQSVATYVDGSVYLTGSTSSTNYPMAAPLLGSLSGSQDGFITKVHPGGTGLVFSTYGGGDGIDAGRDLALDPFGNVYVVGETTSTNFPTSSAVQETLAGGSDYFVAVLDSIGSTLMISTYGGGSGNEVGYGIAVNEGGVYVVGETSSTNFPTYSPVQGNLSGGSDSFAVKYSADGTNLVYSTYCGGNGNDTAYSIALDFDGGALIAGETASTNFPLVNEFQGTNAGGVDVFLARIKENTIQFTVAGSSGAESQTNVTITVSLHIPSAKQVTVAYQAIGGTATGGGEDYTLAAGSLSFSPGETSKVIALDIVNDADEEFDETIIMSLSNPTNAVLGLPGTHTYTIAANDGYALTYSTYIGGDGNDTAYDIEVDEAGSIYVAGETFSTNFPTAAPYQANLDTFSDVFVTKLSPGGTNLVFSTYLGGDGNDRAYNVSVHTSGAVYVGGWTRSTDFPVSNALFSTHQGNLFDAFVSKLSAAGDALIYSTYLGGSGNDTGEGLTVDASGAAYLAGTTLSADYPVTNAYQSSHGGGLRDAIITKISPDGSNMLFSTYLGGSGDEFTRAVEVDSTGSVYIVGFTVSTNFPTQVPVQANHAGGTRDSFVTKFSPDGSNLVFSTYLGGDAIDDANSITIDSSDTAYVIGDTQSTNHPTTNAYQSTYGGGEDAYIAKFSQDGASLVYATYFGGISAENGNGIAIDESGVAYVAGFTASTNMPLASPLQSILNGATDAFASKLSSDGTTLMFSTYLGGSGSDTAYNLDLDSSGTIYLGGDTTSTNLPTAYEFQIRQRGRNRCFRCENFRQFYPICSRGIRGDPNLRPTWSWSP